MNCRHLLFGFLIVPARRKILTSTQTRAPADRFFSTAVFASWYIAANFGSLVRSKTNICTQYIQRAGLHFKPFQLLLCTVTSYAAAKRPYNCASIVTEVPLLQMRRLICVSASKSRYLSLKRRRLAGITSRRSAVM